MTHRAPATVLRLADMIADWRAAVALGQSCGFKTCTFDEYLDACRSALQDEIAEQEYYASGPDPRFEEGVRFF